MNETTTGTGGQAARGGPWRPIMALGLSSLQGVWQSKLVMLALVFSVVHVAIRVAVVVGISFLAPSQIGAFLDAGLLRDTIFLQATLPAVIVLGAVGTRTTTRDRQMGGLEFLLSKSLTRWGYVAARSVGPLVAAAILILLPAILLALTLVALVSPLPAGTAGDLWGAIGMAAVVSLALGPLAAGLGSLVEDLRSATGLWLAVAWATLPLASFLEAAGVDWAWAVAPIRVADATAGTLVGLSFPHGHVALGWLAVALLVILPMGLLYHRTREVYG